MELVGRRFLSVSCGEELEPGGVARWRWRAGLIRAVTTLDTDSPTLAVCVEWDGEPAAERHWRKLRQEWEVFVLEHELVWARRSSTSQENSSLQPALVFRPLVGQSHVSGVVLVEFLSDRQLEFCTNREELHPYEGDTDIGSSVPREDPSGHEELHTWLRQCQLQRVLQLGHGCVKGLRVKVFRPDCKLQWLHGIITNHDHNSRTMTVLNDQTAESLSLDPMLVHVLLLDDISPSVLMKENFVTKHKPHTMKINRTTLNTGSRSSNTTATDQACSSGPVQRKPSQLCRQNSNCSLAEDETEGMREEMRPDEVRPDSSKSKVNHGERKRRKTGHDEEREEKEKKKADLKRLKADICPDLFEGSDSESSNTQSKSLPRKYFTSEKLAECEIHSPAGHLVDDLKAYTSPKSRELSPKQSADTEGQEGKCPPLQAHSPSTSCNGVLQITKAPQSALELNCGKAEEETRDGPKEMEDRCEGASQEDSEAVCALLASQESEQLVSMETPCILLHPSSSECDHTKGEQETAPGDPEARESEFIHPEVNTPSCDSTESVKDIPRLAPTHSTTMPHNTEVDAGKVVKPNLSPGTASSGLEPAVASEITNKPTLCPSPYSCPEVISKPPEIREVSKMKCSSSPVRVQQSSSPATFTTQKTPISLKSTPGPNLNLTPTLQQACSPSPNQSNTPAKSRTPPLNLAHHSTRNLSPPDTPTKSMLIIDRNEPFTIYRDPALVRKELESFSTYVQPPRTPPIPHPKHHLRSSSPSSSSPGLTSSSSHTKILSPTAHILPLALPAQSPLCSSHASIPHPHLLPSLLPGLHPSTALLAGHTQLGPLSLPHHPLALQASQSLLGQSSGTTPMAPLSLYPFLWPPLPNGAHGYSLGLQGSKWTPPESAGISEASLRTNTPSPWLHQANSVTSVEGQGLVPLLPVHPSSADSQRVSRSIHPVTPTSNSTGEMERKAFTDTQSFIHMPPKAEQERLRPALGKSGNTSHLMATEPPSAPFKQPQLVYSRTGDRPSRYQEESRRILQESIEVAPFTAKLGSEREPRYPKSSTPSLQFKEKDKDLEKEMHMFRHSAPLKLQSTQPSPTRTQSSSYSPAAASMENKPSTRRAPPSKELYERLSDPNTAVSVFPSASTQSSVKARPPPLVKHYPEREEGLLGKITEQLASKAVSADPLELGNMERKGCSTSLISISASSSRTVPSLHRAPIFHPPALPITASKETGLGRLSPPTLTPIQPMSLTVKDQNPHRPPTLIPELRHGALAGKGETTDPLSMTNKAYNLQQGGVLNSRKKGAGAHTVNGGVVNSHAATASVIVHPSSYTHTPVNHTLTDGSFPRAHCDHIRTFESVANTHLKDGSDQCKRGVLWTPVDTVHPINMVTSKQDMNMPLNMTTKNMSTTNFSNSGVKYSVDKDTHHPRIDQISKQCEKEDIGREFQPKGDLSSNTCCPPKGLPHVKKRRAGLAALEPKLNVHAVQPLHTTDNSNSNKSVLHTSHNRYSNCTTHSTYTICTAHAVGQDYMYNPSPSKHPRLAPEATGIKDNKPGTLSKVHPLAPSSHTNQPAQSGQSNYHKLKKAWLTRHSEQDRCSVNFKTERDSNSLTTTASVSLPIKQVNGFASKGPTQEDKESSQDNRKSKTLDRKCQAEDRMPNGSDTKYHTEDKKPVSEERKAVLEYVKPTLDRNGILERKKPGSYNRKFSLNVRRPSPVDLTIVKDNDGEKRNFPFSLKSESGGDSGNESESRKSEPGSKRQSKPTFKKKHNDQQRKSGENEKEDDEEDEEENKGKPNGTLRTMKSLHRVHTGIPRSVLKDWRKVKKLKQSGEAFLQDDSCAEIGANVQKCRECRLDRSRKNQEPVVSPVFCRFYFFRRLSFSKNGVVRVDGFSTVEETCEEAVRVWMADFEDEEETKRELELDTAKYILTLIGDKFCQLVKTENTAVTWVRKDTQVMWKRAVRGVREMCDACEATLFNMHWACHKCGFVVCMDCYKARERKSAKDKELYVWVRCVKNQPHDLKNLMPTQIVPERILAELQSSMHCIRREYGIPSQCSCYGSSPFLSTPPITNGLSQLSESVKGQYISTVIPNQQKSTHGTLHKIPTERKGTLKNDEVEILGRKSNSLEQGSTLRDLLTSTAGKLRLGSTGPGIAFAPVYNSTGQTAQTARMPTLLDDIIASVVENKIPASKMAKLGLNQDLLKEEDKVELDLEELKPARIPLADPHTSVPHEWIGSHRLLWLQDHRHLGNQRLFKENWTQEQPVLVSGLHKSLNASLWMPEHFSREFSSLHSDFYNCRDGSITNSCVKEFWDGFEDVSKRPKSAKGDPAVYRLKDWPSGEEFLALMPSRYEDMMRNLPVPEYTGPDGTLNLASRLPSFFIRPDLGPRLCCAHGVTACPEQDFGSSNLHVEISDTMSILVYVGIAKGDDSLSNTGVLKLLEQEALDESAKKRLKDTNDTPGALWHIYLSKDLHKIQEFLQSLTAERAKADAEADSEADWDSEADPLREGSWYLSPALRQRLLEEHAVESRTLLQFYGDAVIIPAGALHQVMNLHSCIQVNVDFVSPEHAHNSYYLTQELRPLKDQVNHEDKLQVKNIFYHSVKDAVAALSRHLKEQSTEELKEEEC